MVEARWGALGSLKWHCSLGLRHSTLSWWPRGATCDYFRCLTFTQLKLDEMNPRWSLWPSLQYVLSVVAGWHFSTSVVVATTASCVCPVVESTLWCACTSHMQCSMKIGLVLCTSGKIAGPFAQMATVNRCAMEKAQGSSWSYNRSTMESVVNQRLVSVGKSFTLANGKSKGKLAPKFIASLLREKWGRGGVSFVPQQGIKGDASPTSLLML